MEVVLWSMVSGYHGSAMLRRTAALLAVGSTTPATAGRVEGAAGSWDHGDDDACEEGEEEVTKQAGGTRRRGGSAGGWEDGQPGPSHLGYGCSGWRGGARRCRRSSGAAIMTPRGGDCMRHRRGTRRRIASAAAHGTEQGGENEQRGREAAVCGIFVSASSVQHRRMEATWRRISKLGRPRPKFKFLKFQKRTGSVMVLTDSRSLRLKYSRSRPS
jgi:hypothetical protein